MDKQELEVRLAFLGIDPEDLACLHSLRPVLERHADGLVAAFYRHLLSFDATRRLLTDGEVKRRLLRKQREYLLSLASGEIGVEYAEERFRIGVAHERVQLEPRWYLGAYAQYFTLLAPLVYEHFAGDLYHAERTLSALMKVLLLDVQLAMDAYIERKERELHYLNDELAAAGRDLAEAMRETRSELRQTERRARAAEQIASVATLVAGLAHEIGTPMGVIQGHAELLESSVTDERGRWRLRTIREQIDRISRIIQALLNSARPRDAERVPVSLESVLETALSFLAEKFRRRRISVETQIAPAPSIVGDAEKLQQLFLNLLLNAVDAMPDGGTITLSVSPLENGGAEVRIRDTGAGIPESSRVRIFDPFFTTKPAGQGSGLGLVIVRSIVAEHDASISVSSEVGRGTEFRIEFPARDASEGAANQAVGSGGPGE